MPSYKLRFNINLLLVWFLLSPVALTAQTNGQKIEEKLQEAKLHIYQNPEKAIKLATIIYQEAKETDTKITALITLVNGYTAINQNENALIFATKALEVAKKQEAYGNKFVLWVCWESNTNFII